MWVWSKWQISTKKEENRCKFEWNVSLCWSTGSWCPLLQMCEWVGAVDSGQWTLLFFTLTKTLAHMRPDTFTLDRLPNTILFIRNLYWRRQFNQIILRCQLVPNRASNSTCKSVCAGFKKCQVVPNSANWYSGTNGAKCISRDLQLVQNVKVRVGVPTSAKCAK